MGGDGSTILEVDGSGAASNWCVYNRDCVYGIGTNANQLNVYGKGTAGINFQVSNVSNAMVIDSNGRVGIGTTSPSAPLEISAGNTQSPLTNGLYVYNSTNVANRDAIIAAQVAGSSGGDAYISLDVKNEYGWSIGLDNDDSNKLKISGDYDSLTAATRMVIDNTGKVGIGTTSPTQLLEVNGVVKASAFQGDGSGLTGISAGKWSDATGGINYTGGKVGIGKSSPSEMLEVNGSVKASSFKKSDGTVLESGLGTAHSVWHKSSDGKERIRWRKNSTTYFRSGHNNSPLFEFRNSSDQWRIKIDDKGRINRYYYD